MQKVIKFRCSYGIPGSVQLFPQLGAAPVLLQDKIYVRNGFVDTDTLPPLARFLAEHLDHIYPGVPLQTPKVLCIKGELDFPVDFMDRFERFDAGLTADYLKRAAEQIAAHGTRIVRIMYHGLDVCFELPEGGEGW